MKLKRRTLHRYLEAPRCLGHPFSQEREEPHDTFTLNDYLHTWRYRSKTDSSTYATYTPNMTYPNSFGIRPTLKHVPTTTNMTVLTMIKTKPVTIEGDKTTTDSGLPVVIASDENPKPAQSEC
jgi:hypothetical protein